MLSLSHRVGASEGVGDAPPRRRAVSAASVLRLLRAEWLLLEANYQRERRQLAARRKAAFPVKPTMPVIFPCKEAYSAATHTSE